jgi:hypothetical protein
MSRRVTPVNEREGELYAEADARVNQQAGHPGEVGHTVSPAVRLADDRGRHPDHLGDELAHPQCGNRRSGEGAALNLAQQEVARTSSGTYDR